MRLSVWVMFAMAAGVACATFFSATQGPDGRPESVLNLLVRRTKSAAAGRNPFDAVTQAVPQETVAVEPAEKEGLADVYACGIVEGKRREIKLRFEVPGTLVERSVAEGARVRKGEILARLDPSRYEAQLAEAGSNVRLAKAELERLVNGAREESKAVARALSKASNHRLEQSKQRLAREEQLALRKATSQAALDDARADFHTAAAAHDADRARLDEIEAPVREDERKVAEAKVSVAEARLRQVEAELDKTILRAPCDGLVLRVGAEVGEMLWPQLAEPVATVVDVSETRVRAYVEEADAFRVAPGQSAWVTADGRLGRRFQGIVVSAAPSMVPKRIYNNMPGERVDVKVREVLVRLEPQDELVIGLPVDVYFSGGSSPAGRPSDRSHRPADAAMGF